MKQISDSSPRHRKILDYIQEIIFLSPECDEYDYMETKITKAEYRQIIEALRFYIENKPTKPQKKIPIKRKKPLR